jgi:hypothetical protein
MPAIRALLVALDEWVTTDRPPPDSRLPNIADGTLVPAEAVAFPKIPGLTPPKAANDAAPPGDWTDPRPPSRRYRPLVPQVGPDGNERAGIRLPDIAVPVGTFTGWNLYQAPYPQGELADRDGTFLAFAPNQAARTAVGDARSSMAELYPNQAAYLVAVEAAVAALQRDRLLLEEDAAAYRVRAQT